MATKNLAHIQPKTSSSLISRHIWAVRFTTGACHGAGRHRTRGANPLSDCRAGRSHHRTSLPSGGLLRVRQRARVRADYQRVGASFCAARSLKGLEHDVPKSVHASATPLVISQKQGQNCRHLVVVPPRFRAAQNNNKPLGKSRCYVSRVPPTVPNALEKGTPRFVRLPYLSDVSIGPFA